MAKLCEECAISEQRVKGKRGVKREEKPWVTVGREGGEYTHQPTRCRCVNTPLGLCVRFCYGGEF